MAAADNVVQLKRRVRNASTELFEWRKCECHITSDSQLVLETVDEDDDDDDERPAGDDAVETDATPSTTTAKRVVIDLAWQLHAIEQKRKFKTRCELQFIVHNVVSSEELMAPSPRDCQEWIELVREAEKRAKRRESIRQGTATASAVAALGASASASYVESPMSVKVTPFNASLSSVSASSRVSSTRPSTAATPLSTRKEAPHKRRGQASIIVSQRNRYDNSEEDEEELRSPVGMQPTAPLPRASSPSSFTQKLTAVRQLLPQDSQLTTETTYDTDDSIDEPPRRTRRDVHQFEVGFEDDDLYEEDAEEEDDDYAPDRRLSVSRVVRATQRPSVHSTVSALPRRKKTPVASVSSLSSSHVTTSHARRVLSPPSSVTSTFVPTSRSRRPLSATRRHLTSSSPSSHRRPPPERVTGASSAMAVAASIQRLRRRESLRGRGDEYDDDDDRDRGRDRDLRDALDGQSDSREELGILMRVESALRHLERENAAAKEREAALAHQVSSLQDALRVRTAEKKHLETHTQQLTRDKDAWKQAAQRAERALAQLQDELVLAQEESQLEHSERHRLKHQNKELLSQVHRLDSIVYGRF